MARHKVIIVLIMAALADAQPFRLVASYARFALGGVVVVGRRSKLAIVSSMVNVR